MKFLMTFIFLSTLSSAFAEVSNQNVDKMLKRMVKDEVISAADAEKALIRLRTMDTQEWKSIKLEAHKVAARSPASITPVGDTSDLNRAQFKQIEDEIRKFDLELRD